MVERRLVGGEEIDWTQRLLFDVRVIRAACVMTTPVIELSVDVAVSAANAIVERIEPGPTSERFKLTPVLLALDEPDLAFSGSLNFGEVAIDAFGVVEEPAPQILTVTISNLDNVCGEWNLSVGALAPTGSPGQRETAIELSLLGVDEHTVDGGACQLTAECFVGRVSAKPGGPSERTFALTIAVSVPSEVTAETLSLTLYASLSESAHIPEENEAESDLGAAQLDSERAMERRNPE
jgi:hypothetical protein